MVTVSKKNKRNTLNQKSKAEQKVKQHFKDVKENLKKQKSKPEKASVPLKAKISQEIEQSKLKEKELQRKRQHALNIINKKVAVNEFVESKTKLLKDSSRAFVGDVKKLMDEANVIIEVLDARDPNGTRSLEAEKEIKARNKTLVFVLNKIDLVPTDNMKSWLRYLSKEARVFPFKASCQEQANNIGGSARRAPNINKAGPSAAYGVDELVNFLKSLTKGPNAVTKNLDKLVVGVVGVPNTGKSSLINSLRRKRICEAGSTPGLTRNLQHIALDNHMTVIDSPGIVLSKSDDPAEYALRNCVRVEKIEDTVAVAAVIFSRCGAALLHEVYKLPYCGGEVAFEQFLVQLALRCVPLKKGGVANVRLASVKMINDWNSGKIEYCSQPPVSLGASGEETVVVLSEQQEEAIKALTSGRDHAVMETAMELAETEEEKGEQDIVMTE